MRYPTKVKLDNGTTVQTTENTWKERHLVIETDRSEKDVRYILSKEGFKETDIEYPKSGRLGRGMIKEFEDWQVHVRLFQHNDNIQIDGEVEVSIKYFEHLTHDWLPAFDFCADIFREYFNGFYVYHQKYERYLTDLWDETVLSIGDPESKTSVVGLAVGAGLAIGAGLLIAWSKK